ncbi:FAD/NAD(P)-binding protein [Sinorhizobium sp. RAC02]|uniref:FAD/NAD(P)-binding protein n=1 Tax=Sinorhizobium sp. RAC02 TaxID=1842534 RepID=UPI00083D7ADB|nr:FAD/NAD(P)-binding protein [Sinorhizobium sp. RAC02]AOF92538.1 FAD-NAD(P)-binding family protein [Sinorhizobium sp. RAC02]
MMQIAVIGAGLSGLATTIALMKRFHQPFEAWLIDAEDAPGAFGNGPAGKALATEPARDLSVIPDRPDDFADWLNGSLLADGAIASLRGPQDLHVPRALFRDYVLARFSEALSLRKDIRIRTFLGEVRDAVPRNDRVQLRFREGDRAEFDHVFIATGLGAAQREADSWRAAHAAADRLSQCEEPPVLTLLGNGPRFAAILLDLRASGYAGPVNVRAATGSLPQPHGRGHDRANFGPPPASRSLRDAFHYIRRECRSAENRETGQWQSVVDTASLRLSVVWRNLPQKERNHYRRHLLDLHRQFSVRIARDIHRRLVAELETGRTHFVSSRFPQRKDDNTIDCRETPSASALARLLGADLGLLSVNDSGGLLVDGNPLPGLSLVGTAASSLRPGPFVFAETVRQAYRAVLDMQRHTFAVASSRS